MENFYNHVYWGNAVSVWLTALLIFIVAVVVIRLFKGVIIKSLKRLTSKTQTAVDDFLIGVVEVSVLPMAYIAAAYFALSSLVLPARYMRIIHIALLVGLTYFFLKIITTVTKAFIFSFIKRQENSETKEKQANGLVIILNIIIWLLGIVFLIDNFGYDVTAIVAGLGIGGIAIALAAQTILGDLFSYFVIFFDRPFEIGDFIIVDDKMGVVEYIGIKTTRIKTLSGEQLVCSNTDLTNSRLHNFKRMERRRVVFKLGVVYETSQEKLKEVPQIVRAIIEGQDNVQFDRGHFSGFGNFSLDFEFVYYVNSPDYNLYMDIQQGVLLAIFEAFNNAGIGFAYPTQTLFINTPQPQGIPKDVA